MKITEDGPLGSGRKHSVVVDVRGARTVKPLVGFGFRVGIGDWLACVGSNPSWPFYVRSLPCTDYLKVGLEFFQVMNAFLVKPSAEAIVVELLIGQSRKGLKSRLSPPDLLSEITPYESAVRAW